MEKVPIGWIFNVFFEQSLLHVIMENEVINFISEFTGVKPDKILPKTLIADDLGIDGDDGIDFIEAFSNRFGVDINNFEFSDYFGPEGFDILFVFGWIIYAFKRLMGHSAHEIAGTKPFPVSLLIKAAKEKRWESNM